jgi:hypothetical protein
MAKVRDNLVTEGLSGKLGRRLVFRKGRGGSTIVAVSPTSSTPREYSASELEHQEDFKEAIQYAKVAKNQPLYIERARGTEATAYNLAVADWFGEPQVLEIDASAWSGQIGQTIRIKAKDDTQVTGVHVVIQKADDTVVEQGQAVLSDTDGLWWVYTATSLLPAGSDPRIIATARDLAGNRDGMIWQNN